MIKWKLNFPKWASDAIILFIASLGFMLLVTTAHCQAPCAPDIPPAQRKLTMEHEGVLGTWVHHAVRKCELKLIKQLRAPSAEVKLLREKLHFRQREMDTMKGYLQLAGKSNQRLGDALMSASQEQARSESILHSDVLWFSLGLIAGGSLLYLVMR